MSHSYYATGAMFGRPVFTRNRGPAPTPQPRPPTVVDAEFVETYPAGAASPVAPAGQMPSTIPTAPVAQMPDDVEPLEYHPAGQAHPGIPDDTWRRMSVEQQLTFLQAPAAQQREMAQAVAGGVAQIITGIFSSISQEQRRAADAASEERVERLRRMLREDAANRPVVHYERSTADLPATAPSTGNVFTHQLGGVPVWGWGLIAVGVAGGGYYAYTKLGQGKKKRGKK